MKKKESELKRKKSERKTTSKLFLTWIGPVTAAIMTVLYMLNMLGILPPEPNQPPEIQDGIRLPRPVVSVGEMVPVRVFATDPNLPDDEIGYDWRAHRGKIGEQLYRFQGPDVIYIAPDLPGIDVIEVTVYDRKRETDESHCIVTIKEAERLSSP